MSNSNFCTHCGARLTRKGWLLWLPGPLCEDCARRPGVSRRGRTLFALGLLAIASFALGRYFRPSPPPLLIQRAANSPLSDAPLNPDGTTANNSSALVTSARAATNDDIYICGARTKKGTPCKRRVQIAGERCFQHKGREAMVALEKLVTKRDAQKR